MDVTLEELWYIMDAVRFGADDREGSERDQQMDVHLGILVLQADPNIGVYTLSTTEEFLWRCERKLREGYKVGPKMVGRELLLKVMMEIRIKDGRPMPTKSMRDVAELIKGFE